MSSDPTKPEPSQDKMVPKPSQKAKEATELDLWDLDSDAGDAHGSQDTPSEIGAIPARRAADAPSVRSKKPTERPIEVPVVGEAKAPGEKPVTQRPGKQLAEKAAPVKPAGEYRKTGEERETPEPNKKENAEKSWNDSDEAKAVAPAAEPVEASAKSFLSSLTKVERIAITVLVAALALGGTLTAVHFANRVPTRSPLSEKIDFPVKGKLVEITAATTFWREPVTSGENADVVRRGTKLIPVLKLSLRAKPCAVRIFFRNEDGLVIGDGITRVVSGETELTIPATAGFDDIGMHAAYRTGESLPWVVQILEGPDRGSSREKFQKILETDISTDIR